MDDTLFSRGDLLGRSVRLLGNQMPAMRRAGNTTLSPGYGAPVFRDRDRVGEHSETQCMGPGIQWQRQDGTTTVSDCDACFSDCHACMQASEGNFAGE